MSKQPVPPRAIHKSETPGPSAAPTDAKPEINIVNLNHKEFAVLNLLREIDYGQLDIQIQDSRIDQVFRRQRVSLPRSKGSGAP